jgi:hypothetical protein
VNEAKEGEPSDYGLKIDAQVEKFVEIKQKLTYFLVTASTAIIAFLASFVKDQLDDIGKLVWLIILSSVAGLFTSGLSLRNLNLEIKSYKLHLQYRYEKRDWNMLTDDEKSQSESINSSASEKLNAAFVCIFAEIAFAVSFFVLFFL